MTKPQEAGSAPGSLRGGSRAGPGRRGARPRPRAGRSRCRRRESGALETRPPAGQAARTQGPPGEVPTYWSLYAFASPDLMSGEVKWGSGRPRRRPAGRTSGPGARECPSKHNQAESAPKAGGDTPVPEGTRPSSGENAVSTLCGRNAPLTTVRDAPLTHFVHGRVRGAPRPSQSRTRWTRGSVPAREALSVVETETEAGLRLDGRGAGPSPRPLSARHTVSGQSPGSAAGTRPGCTRGF